MTVQGTTSAATTNVAMPTHQAGDLLCVFTRGAAVPTKPTASGTVPNWTIAQAALANSIALSSAWVVATAANHTTGTWTSATHICVLVLRPGAGNFLGVGGSQTGNANNTQSIVYPALTLTTAAGTSWGVRCGTRTVAVTAVATAPTGWTNQIVQPAAAGALMSVHTRAALTGNPVADTVTTTGTNAASRAHTLEVTEQVIPVTTLQRLTTTGKVRVGAAAITLTLSPAPAVGNAVVITVNGYRAAGMTFGAAAVTDNRGNPYALATERRITTNGEYATAIFYCARVVTTGTPFTITITGVSGDFFVGSAVEVGGLTGGQLTLTAWQNNAPVASASVTTGATSVVTGEALVAASFVRFQTTASITAEAVSPIWTEEYEELDGTNWIVGEGNSRITNFSTTTQANWTMATSGAYAAAIAVFQRVGLSVQQPMVTIA